MRGINRHSRARSVTSSREGRPILAGRAVVDIMARIAHKRGDPKRIYCVFGGS
jgi:hypothetical protein